MITRYLLPAIGAGLGSCHAGYRFAYWLGTTQPEVFGIRDAYPGLLLWSGAGAAAGVAVAGIWERRRRRGEAAQLRGWLLEQMGRADLPENDRAAIAALYQELGHHPRPSKGLGG